ncbi:MAG TPA: DEAD/DEAH box helicase family protein [Candidatus Polarisedimenticolia bacterium]|jgi:superfamily II DNA or RNA helicase|nr:DEAD/DEAH box helicase family protein [Candidatus Polarisedimenticolia bacterium]
MKSTRADLLSLIAQEEGRLAKLNSERKESCERLKALRRELEATIRLQVPGSHVSAVNRPSGPISAVEKVALFRSLFRGRDDVFPTRFLSKKSGQSGYAPACANKFVKGVCELPKIRCGECPNQAFLSVNDQVVLGHLRGRHVMGVYPLLRDATCWFLAVDFDKASWKEDVASFIETCRIMGVPCSLERSRSGNGAHAWFFFASPIPSALARKMGSHLLTETMARRHQLSMDSYDRLFPNQDTMPHGGFGNLIALPLQYEARRRGNTVFLDAGFEPYLDQWAYLAAVPRLEPEGVEAIAREAERRDAVVGVRIAEPMDDEGTEPRRQLPMGNSGRSSIPGPLPSEVNAVLAQRLFIDKDAVPSPLLNEIKRLAAFQNPEFYRRQSMRLSIAKTPRVISCAQELPRHIALPRGCRSAVEGLLKRYDIKLSLDDQRHEGQPLCFQFRGELTPLQERAAKALLPHDIGVFVGPPGIGKTVLGAHLIAQRGRSTLILVHRRPLLDQWVAQISAFLGVDEKEVGQIGGGKRNANSILDVAMIQSLVRGEHVDDIVATYGHVIVDECHHVPAVSFERVLSEVKARYVLGLTATPNRRDGHHPILEMQLGPARFCVEAKSPAARQLFKYELVVRETSFWLKAVPNEVGIQDIYGALAADEQRNRLVLDDVIRAVELGASPVLLTERRDHLDYFAAKLRGFVRNLIVLRGGGTPKQRQKLVTQLAEIPEDEERLILATGRYIGEGFDDIRLDTLFLAMPISWKGTLAQYAGRLHRIRPGKTTVRIFDYVDGSVPVLRRMFEKRLRAYRALGYVRGEPPSNYSDPVDEPHVEYDEKAPCHFDDLGGEGP